MLFFNVQWDIFKKCHKLQPGLVVRWAYPYQILAVEMKNTEKLVCSVSTELLLFCIM